MGLAFDDRVQDTSTTTGTGDLTLSGTAPTGRVDFNTAFGTTVRFPYMCESATGADWEVGIGYLSASTTLVREEIKRSSNSNSAVSFASGTKTVSCVWPAFMANEYSNFAVANLLARGIYFP